MIFIGTDIVKIERIDSLLRHWSDHFKSKVFSPEEIEYCEQQPRPSMHFAGRFAAKEAIKKAVYSSGWDGALALNSISVIHSESGAPIVELGESPMGRVIVTISHTDEYATATAVLESDG